MPVSQISPKSDTLKVDRVYHTLRDRIMSLSLAPGSVLRKEEIAAELGVSRAPVSDAISRLAEEGYVDVFRQHGSFVAKIRSEDVRVGLFIRTALEIEAVRQAAMVQDASLNSVLAHNLAAQQLALDAGDMAELYRLDEAMHDVLFGAANLPRAAKILETARAPIDRMRQILLPMPGRPEATVKEHRWIIEAVASGNPEFAAAAMRAHLGAVASIVEMQLATLEGDLTP